MERIGTFQITSWQESVDKEFNDGAKLSSAIVLQTYTGDLSGTSEIRYQLCYDSSGNAIFVGFETITVATKIERDIIVLKHDGTFKNGVASSQFVVVKSSTDETLVGKMGTFTSTEGAQANYQIFD